MRNVAMLSAVLCIITASQGQTPVREPEFAEVFFRLQNGALGELERQPVEMKGGAHGFIAYSVKVTSRLPGGKSAVRFKAGEALAFVVRSPLAAGAADPAARYCLRKLDAKKDHREVTITGGKFTPIGGSTTTNFQQGTVPVTFEKYGQTSYAVRVEHLAAGEYAIGSIYPQTLFAFGVDGANE
jgi:hypothetical protein